MARKLSLQRVDRTTVQRRVKKKLTYRERVLALHLECEAVLARFLRRCSRPRRRYDVVSKALDEVRNERLLLQTDMKGWTTTRALKVASADA